MNIRNITYFSIILLLLVAVGFIQSWSVAFALLNLCLISAIMALGVNIQWGYAGLFSVGTTGFVALGGVAAVITSMPPVREAWAVGGTGVLSGLLLAFLTIVAAVQIWKRMRAGRMRALTVTAVLLGGFILYRFLFDPAVAAIEAVNPAGEGYLGGLGLHIIFSWIVGGILAAGAAWVIGKVALGLKPI